MNTHEVIPRLSYKDEKIRTYVITCFFIQIGEITEPEFYTKSVLFPNFLFPTCIKILFLGEFLLAVITKFSEKDIWKLMLNFPCHFKCHLKTKINACLCED